MNDVSRLIAALFLVLAVPARSEEPEEYLSSALQLMQAHSVVRDQVDWGELRESAVTRAAGASTTRDTYPALREALQEIGDGHSFLLEPDQAAQWASENPEAPTGPTGAWLPGGVAYLRVVPIGSTNPATTRGYAVTLQGLIRRYERSEPRGWIIDLRGNTGGNMWPMLAGLGPLLGDGTHGFFVSPAGDRTPWRYEGGKALEADRVITEVPGPPWQLEARGRTAVLTDGRTLSSGEAIAISFRGRADSRSFGETTGGLVTSNENFELSDGAVMLLATKRFADRNGTVYAAGVIPEERVYNGNDAMGTQDDPVVRAATRWIEAGR